MEIGTPVWVWDKGGIDANFPDDTEACGLWRQANVTGRRTSSKGVEIRAAFSDEICSSTGSEWSQVYAAELAADSTDLQGLKLRNVKPGSLAAGRWEDFGGG
eukprot:CAMPEP_0171689146 /NCGR_PEP_ID=MMETSP0991-20121206/4286_1 /TAXON_ID=483369 /ORGANISM="non described non described, Strain CCMP2098" /LENGTH=101 /DNA_ID=CAMNT_0012277161 /DNA_START=84 /DNA_END=386 /DNA_ORIENTATION=-